MKTIFVLLSLFLTFTCFGQTEPQVSTLPDGWKSKVEKSGEQTVYRYYFENGVPADYAQLSLKGAKEAIAREDFSAELKKAADAISAKLKNAAWTAGTIEGTSYQGDYVLFDSVLNIQDKKASIATLLVTNGETTWSGDYLGAPDRWSEALEIIKSLQ